MRVTQARKMGGAFAVIALFLISLSVFATCGGTDPQLLSQQKDAREKEARSQGGSLSSPSEESSTPEVRIERNASPAVRITPEGTLEGPHEALALEGSERTTFARWEYSDFLKDRNLGGYWVSHRRLLIRLRQGATVKEVNGVLERYGARIRGNLPAIRTLLLHFPNHRTLPEMYSVWKAILQERVVELAAPDSFLFRALVTDPPGPPEVVQINYIWETPPSGGNWNLEAARVPQAWDFQTWIRRQNQPAEVAIIDKAFDPNHQDFPVSFEMVSREHEPLYPTLTEHGNMVAGIIAAKFRNSLGVDGISALSHLVLHPALTVPVPSYPFPYTAPGTIGELLVEHFEYLLGLDDNANPPVVRYPNIRVVNISFVYDWYVNKLLNRLDTDTPCPDVDHPENWPTDKIYAKCLVTYQGRLFARTNQDLRHERVNNGGKDFVVVSPAGNDSSPDAQILARWGSPVNYAGLATEDTQMPHMRNIMVAEATRLIPGQPGQPPTYERSHFSNTNANISAPGEDVLFMGTGPQDYNIGDGTSLSTPAVAGTSAYMISLFPCPGTVDSLVNTVICSARGSIGNGGARMVDTFSAVLGLDLSYNSTCSPGLDTRESQKRLVDADDGTVDGNLRARALASDPDPDDVHAIPPGQTVTDRRRGDGKVTARDFRAFRDGFLQSQPSLPQGRIASQEVSLDGDPTHFKKDLNLDGCRRDTTQASGLPVSPPHPSGHPDPPPDIPTGVNCGSVTAPVENVYPRYDFNGDGRITANSVNPSGGDVAPFKIDAATDCSQNRAACLRDIDVMTQVWASVPAVPPDCSAISDEVSKQHCMENIGANVADEGADPFTATSEWRWQPRHNLLADRNSDGSIDYLYSADVHISGEEVVPPSAEKWIVATIRSVRFGGQDFVRKIRISRDEWPSQRLIATLPLYPQDGWNPEGTPEEQALGPRIKVSFSWGTCFQFTNVRYGQDMAVTGTGEPCTWAIEMGDSDRVEWAAAVTQASEGDYVIVGQRSEPSPFCPGSSCSFDAWIIRLSRDGEVLWQKSLGIANSDERVWSVDATDDDGAVLAGHTNSDGWVVKINSIGDVVFQKVLPAQDRCAYFPSAVRNTSTNGMIVAGSYYCSPEGGPQSWRRGWSN
jgi:subtilisin family serine protease